MRYINYNYLSKGILLTGIFGILACGKSVRNTEEIPLSKQESDLIKLLDANQENVSLNQENLEYEALKQRIAELEQAQNSQADEINILKSELLLRNERIRQLESTAGTIGNVNENKPAPVRLAQPNKSLTAYEQNYQSAYQDFRARKYEQSRAKFINLLNGNRSHPLADNCQYWIGENNFMLNDYEKAIIAFEKVFTYPNSNKDDDAQIKLGICYFRMGDTERAKIEFTKLKNNYPKSEYVARANNFLNLIDK